MEQSYSESDLSLSPSQILERLQVLRQLQLLQRGKLQKHRLQYQETNETSSSITEIVSQFSNSTSYNTFRSLLQSSHTTSEECTPRFNGGEKSPNVQEKDLIEGVSVLNLSQESEFVVSSPVSSKSCISSGNNTNTSKRSPPINRNVEIKSLVKKQIALDDMPILSPKQDFEALILEKLKNEKPPKPKSLAKDKVFITNNKKPFLKRGEGMSRYGLRKNDLVIQNTKSLPWKRKSFIKSVQSPLTKNPPKKIVNGEKAQIQILEVEHKKQAVEKKVPKNVTKEKPKTLTNVQQQEEVIETVIDSSNCELHKPKTSTIMRPPTKPPVKKSQTWAAVLTKEQDDFLRKLKQSDYYKNFVSPAKSTVSNVSCYDNSKLEREKEIAEQNMFELIENKVGNDSFSIDNSFFNRFLKSSQLECSGESTPLILQKCISSNPHLMHLLSEAHQKRNRNSPSEAECCNSECNECYSDCSSVCSACSCETSVTTNKKVETRKQKDQTKINKKESKKPSNKSQNDTVPVIDEVKTDIAEMNAKLVATSELLKDRLQELEDEIETFRKENANLGKLREEMDIERQKFYEEKNTFEQKYNEEKVLSEYYLAEEKEKLAKQKQMYERYVREMRGRLNKKDKDEVVLLKKEITDLKEEIRIKDAKSTSTIARLRNQLKIIEKEKKDAQDEIEKLKKDNRRIQHSNDITRRLTNLKYLEQINKKLNNMSTKDTRSEVNLDKDVKYKSYEIERQSRSRRVQPDNKTVRPRAKSVPNLKVTSRYAKYFSQRDANSETEKNLELLDTYQSDNDMEEDNDSISNHSVSTQGTSDNEHQNHLEKIYQERFQSISPCSNRSSLNSNVSNPTQRVVTADVHNNNNKNPDPFFIRNTSSRNSKSPNTLKSLFLSTGSKAISTSSTSNNNSGRNSPTPKVITSDLGDSNTQRSKSPISILSNRSSSRRLATVIDQDMLLNVSPEPVKKKNELLRTNLSATELKKPDGSKELRFPNGNVKYISADGKYSKFVYYNGDVKENFYDDGRIKYFYAEPKTYHTTYADGLEILEFPDGQVEKRYKDGSSEIRLPNGSVRYQDPKNEHVTEEWRFPDGTKLTVSAGGERRVEFPNGQIEVHAKDHKRREFPDGTVKLVYTDGTAETRYSSGRIRIKDKHGNLIMDSAPG